MWSLGCALYKWTTGKEFAYVATGARLQDTLHLVPPSYGDKVHNGFDHVLVIGWRKIYPCFLRAETNSDLSGSCCVFGLDDTVWAGAAVDEVVCPDSV